MNDERLKQLKRMGILLDSRIEGPFGIRFGLDALLGLVPVIGDFSTSAASLYIIGASAQMGVPMSILLRMIVNVVIEDFIGVIPVVGNLFDFAWKSNNRNVALIENYLAHPHNVARRSNFFIAIFFLFLFLIFLGTLAISIFLFSEFFRWFAQRS